MQALHLVAMFLGIRTAGFPDGATITKLTFQARVHGYNTDDLVVDFVTRSGDPGTLLVQAKRNLRATAANDVFHEAVGLAWLDFKDESFRRGRDVLMIVYLPSSAKAMEPAKEVQRQAFTTTSAATWRKKLFTPGFGNDALREAFSAIEEAATKYNLVGEVALEELHQFAMHLVFQHLDLDSDATTEVLHQHAYLQMAIPDSSAATYWMSLVTVCRELNDTAGDIDLTSAPRHIGEDLNNAFAAWRAYKASTSRERPGLQHALLPGMAVAVAGALSAATLVTQPPTATFVDEAPAARPSALMSIVSRQLDDISELQKNLRYAEASERLESLGHAFENFDTYHKALWHLQRGMSRWHLSDDPKGAAEDFLRAAELYDEGPKFAAARIRGHLLLQNLDEALKAGKEASLRFPSAYEVWVAFANAKVVNGDVLGENDIPAELRDLAISWQVVASAQEKAGNLIEAFRLAHVGLSKKDASFFNREVLLRYALQEAVDNKVNAGFRILAPQQALRLRTAIDAFMPKAEKLWSATQSPRAIAAAVTHLSYAHMLVGNPQAALDLLAEARSRGIDLGGADLRIELDAHRDLGTSAVALQATSSRLAEMPNDALVSFGQTAMDLKDEAHLTAASDEAAKRISHPEGPLVVQTLRNLRWELLLRTKRQSVVSDEVAAAGIDERSSSIVDLMFAVRSVVGANAAVRKRVKRWLDRVAELVSEVQDPGELHLAAQLFHRHARYVEAAATYERFLPPQGRSRLHADLLDCYLKLGQWAKAREFVAGFPAGWESDADLRGMSLNLAQYARDWREVLRLAEIELGKESKESNSWLLRFAATVHSEDRYSPELLADAPLNLRGTAKELARLAAMELQYGDPARGLLRLYFMRRKRLNEAESAALHLSSILFVRANIDLIDKEPEVAAPGVCVVMEGEDGLTRHLTIDPDELVGLPPTDEFVPSSSAEARQLLHKRVGDELGSKDLLGAARTFRIVKLLTAHRRLIDLSHVAIQTTLTPPKSLVSMQMEMDEEGHPDFGKIQEQLERRALYATETLDLYRQNPAPLGIIAKRLGTDTIEMVRSWPHTGPKLEMVTDWGRSLIEAASLLEGNGAWVLDLSMLTELVRLGQEDLLEHVPQVYVATAVRDAVRSKLEESAVYRKSGVMFTQDGKLGFVEHTEEDWRRDRAFFQAMAACIDKHCIATPAYGPLGLEPTVVSAREIFSDDEYATLLLALQLSANVLTLDDRFRRICALFGRGGAWPQPFFDEMLVQGKMEPDAHIEATLRLLLSRRTFVSVDWLDLMFLFSKEDDFIRAGLHALRDYLSDGSLDFRSGERVVFSTVAALYRGGVCSGALAVKVLECLAEGLFRHPNRPEGWFASAAYQAWHFMHLRVQQVQDVVLESLRLAEGRSKRPPEPVAIDLSGLRKERLEAFQRAKLPSPGTDAQPRADVVAAAKLDEPRTAGSPQDLGTPDVSGHL